jgi:hypothetical protein
MGVVIPETCPGPDPGSYQESREEGFRWIPAEINLNKYACHLEPCAELASVSVQGLVF